MNDKTKTPKVFISYAWGDKEYQDRVVAFATSLSADGINVILDKWDLKEGNDGNAFMERCVSDPEVTNVLILIDPIYAEKADGHLGGVGTETQIISAKVYSDVEQDKFLPVVMKRDVDGNICKPIYLNGRIHFDLSIPEEYDVQYKNLVKTLFGKDIYPKPKVGLKPAWVDESSTVSSFTLSKYSSLQALNNETVRKERFASYLGELLDRISKYIENGHSSGLSNEEYLALYDSTQPIRDDFLQLIKYGLYVRDSYKLVADFLESVENLTEDKFYSEAETIKIRVHEMFIYVIAFFLKNKENGIVGYLLGKTYFEKFYRDGQTGATNYDYFYSGRNQTNLDNAVNAKGKADCLCATVKYWLETINYDFCTNEEFIFADLICFNYAVYGANYRAYWIWFPITYAYDEEYNSCISKLAKRLVSKEYAEYIISIFGYNSIEELIVKANEIASNSMRKYREIRYSWKFNPAPLIGYYIKPEEIATLP